MMSSLTEPLPPRPARLRRVVLVLTLAPTRAPLPADNVGEGSSDDASEADGTESEADDESESNGEDGEESDNGSSDTLSAYSETTRQWILETGSDAGNTEPHETDWRSFDAWHDNDDPGAADAGYSSWIAENDHHEAIQNLESDNRFVLLIAERVLQELCRIVPVPVTKEEMDQLVQAQYELDLERYE